MTVYVEISKTVSGQAALDVKVSPRWPRSRQPIEDYELEIQRPDERLNSKLRGDFLRLGGGTRDAIFEMYEEVYDDFRKIRALRYQAEKFYKFYNKETK